METRHPFQINIEVRCSDFDGIGHVKQSLYSTYFEEGRKALFQSGLNGPASSGLNFIVTQLTCQYLKPIRFEDQPLLKMGVSWIKNISFGLVYEIVDARDGRQIFCKGSSVQVCYDHTHRQEIPLSADVRLFLQKLKIDD